MISEAPSARESPSLTLVFSLAVWIAVAMATPSLH